MIRTLIIAGSALSLLASPAFADDKRERHYNGRHNGWYKQDRDNQRYGDDRRYRGDDRYAGGYDNRRYDERYDRRGSWSEADARRYAAQRGWPSYRYYPDRPPVASAWYPDRHYRSGSAYQPRKVGWNEPVWRGNDNRYYCRRSDGTAGLIIGGLSGGALGAAIAPGSSKPLGAILGGGLGAVLGKNLADNKVTCR